MFCSTCAFETERLSVRAADLAMPDQRGEIDLPGVVMSLLTPAVTKDLPPSWAGPYDRDRARRWIAERVAEEADLLVVSDRGAGLIVGLMILYEAESDDGSARVDVRLGYLLAEAAQGVGLASELVAGFVGWCRSGPDVATIVGGVDRANAASQRVLEKAGFTPVGLSNPSDEAQVFMLSVGE